MPRQNGILPTAATDAAADPVRRAETWVLTAQAPAGQLAAFAVAVLVASGLPPAVAAWKAGLWLGAVAVVSGLRALGIRRAAARADGPLPPSAVRNHLAWTLGSGALWAILPWLLPGEVTTERMILVTFGILGLTAGAAVTYAPARLQFEAFAVPPVVSLGVRLLAEEHPTATAAALLCPVYLVAMIWLGRRRREDALSVAAMGVVLESLHRAALHYHDSPQESLRDLLAAGCRYFGLDLGIVSEIRGEEYRVIAVHSTSGSSPFQPGDAMPLAETVCAYTVRAEGPVRYARGDPGGRLHPAHQELVPTYIGQAILVDGEPFGTVSFSDPDRVRFRPNRYHQDLVGVMAQWLGSEISRRRAEDELTRQRYSLELLIDSLPALISYVTPERTYAYVNIQYERYFSRSRESLVGASVESLAGEETWARLRPHLERALAGEEQWFEFTPEFPDGRKPTFSVHYVPDWSHDGRVRGCFALLNEVTEYKATESRLLEEIRTDYLTGLLNRRGFLAVLAELLADHRKRPAEDFVCYLDLDRFKRVNDRAGHAAGDEVLRQVAALMRDALRRTDVLARIGGDEFGLVLVGCTQEEAGVLLETLRNRIARQGFAWGEHTFRLGAGIGAVAIDRSRHRVQDLLQEADDACYAAKRLPARPPVFAGRPQLGVEPGTARG
jgi:diguanylate cyclase (GGDEF)-like protein/PAS domain S-box-containing protein